MFGVEWAADGVTKNGLFIGIPKSVKDKLALIV